MIRVAIVGIGAMGLGIIEVLRKFQDISVVAIADIDPSALKKGSRLLPERALVTTNPTEILDAKPDIMIDATPAILEGATLSISAMERKIHVILMNSEVDQVLGRLLAKKAEENGVILTSDAGDQYGVLARLIEEVKSMGFEIVMAGNNKGFLDRYANPESIREEAAKRRLTLKQCTSYTDGTKMAIEMAIIANSQNLSLLRKGMIGPRTENLTDIISAFGLKNLEKARELRGVVDYAMGAKPGGSVFVIGYSNDPEDRFYMDYYKMGKGPYYLFIRPYHLCHFETPHTIRRIVNYGEPILVQRRRVTEVCAHAKIDLKSGTKLEGIGGHHLYGLLEGANSPNVPIGVAEDALLIKGKARDEPIEWDDVEFQKGDPLLELWHKQNRIQSE